MVSRAIVVVALLLVGALAASCGPKDVPAGAAGHSFKDAADGVSLDVPAQWETKENVDESRAVFYAPVTGTGYRPDVRLMVLPRTGIRSMEHYLELCKRQAELLEGAKGVVAKTVTHANGQEALQIECEYAEMGDLEKGGTRVKMKQYAFLSGKKQYVVTARVAVADAAAWTPAMDKILDSLTIW